MSIATPRTKTEQALLEQFEAVAGKLPGDAAIAAARKAAIGRFAGLGLPHRRIEAWKYTDLRNLVQEAFAPALPRPAKIGARELDAALGPSLAALDGIRIVFIDGALALGLCRFDGERGKTYNFDPLAKGLAGEVPDWLAARFAGATGARASATLALNAAFATDGALLRVEAGARLDHPIHLVFAASGAAPESVTTRNFILIGEEARAVILESHIGLGAAASQINTATEIAVRDGARVSHVKVAGGGANTTHLGAWIAELGEEACYRAFQFTAGTRLVRNDISVAFAGEGAALDLSGAFLARGSEHIDTTLVVDHAVPHCTSRELFKGVLDDRARGVFQGKIIVRPDAQKSDGKQMAQVLMLSPGAEFDSKPELEIFADDVACGHGSTAAELDAELLFYCQSRGIPLAEARALLTLSFVGEAIEKVEHEGVREALMEAARAWLVSKDLSGALGRSP